MNNMMNNKKRLFILGFPSVLLCLIILELVAIYILFPLLDSRGFGDYGISFIIIELLIVIIFILFVIGIVKRSILYIKRSLFLVLAFIIGTLLFTLFIFIFNIPSIG
jgi:hypothetical protein